MLTHVCRAWRDVFTSCSSLWTNFRCTNAEETRVYLERSKSFPINLHLDREDGLFPHDPFLQLAPHALGRLKHLVINTTEDHFQNITNYFSRPAPQLRELSIFGSSPDPFINPVLATTLFDGDLSSLRRLCLFSLHTTLPWRNMINLTSFSLGYVVHPGVTIGQLLDFFESAPSLLEVDLAFSTPDSGAQNGRLVSLAHLRKLDIYGHDSPSLLLEHLLIPVGVRMSIDIDVDGPRIEDYLPRSLDNLRNLSNFTKIRLDFRVNIVSLQFAGPNGRVLTCARSSGADPIRLVAQSLTMLDTSKTKWMEILRSTPPSGDLHLALLSMDNLRTLTLSLCTDLRSFILALAPVPNSANPIACPKLECLILRTGERFDIETMVEVAAARASRGSPLKYVSIINWGELVFGEGATELLKHVSHVETSFEISDEDYGVGSDYDVDYGYSDYSDEEDGEGGSPSDEPNIT